MDHRTRPTTRCQQIIDLIDTCLADQHAPAVPLPIPARPWSWQ